jgi:hypothetical protein
MILFVLCESQASRRGVEPEDFGRSLSGSIADAIGALADEMLRMAPPDFRGDLRSAFNLIPR